MLNFQGVKGHVFTIPKRSRELTELPGIYSVSHGTIVHVACCVSGFRLFFSAGAFVRHLVDLSVSGFVWICRNFWVEKLVKFNH